MEKSNVLNQILCVPESTSGHEFLILWESCLNSNLINFVIEHELFYCKVNDVVLAEFDGSEIFIKIALNLDCQQAFRSELIKKGFNKPLIEEIQYFPVSGRIEGPSYISSYQITNEFNEVVQALKELKLDNPISAKAKRINENFYNLTLIINQDSEIKDLKNKNKSSGRVIKSAMVCLCLGFLSLDALADETPRVDSLEFNNEIEAQVIKYKKVIDKHIDENVLHDPTIEAYHERAKTQVQRSASKGANEIIKQEYRFEESFRNKLGELEDAILGNDEPNLTHAARSSNGKSTQKVSEKKSQEGMKFKNKTRILQGQVKLEAGHSDYASMKVEANAFAEDKVRANLETKKVEFKDLGVKVYGHARYLSGNDTVVSGVRSSIGENVDFSLYNRQTKQSNKPKNENVMELRYQVDF